MANTKEIYLTDEGLQNLKDELQNLKEAKRPEVIEALKEARSLGDLSENAEYDAARAAQREVEGRIKELEVMLENAVVIEKTDTDKVSIGSHVTVEYVDDDEQDEYTIVGSTEADPLQNKISNLSPLAIAILGKKVGETVKVDSPNGSYDLKIIAIG